MVEPEPTWSVPREIVSVPVKALEPSRTRIPAVVLAIAPPPLISVTFRSVPDWSCRLLIGRVSEPMVKPLRSSEALSRRRVEVTEAKPLPTPLPIELRTSTVPPVMISDATESPLAFEELPRMTGPLMVTAPPEMFTVPDAIWEELWVEVLGATFRPVAPIVTVPPEMFSVPEVVPVWAPTVLAREPRTTEVALSVPALMLNVAVVELPSLPVRPPTLSVLARMSMVCPRRSISAKVSAPVVEETTPMLMAARPVPARLRMTSDPRAVSRKFTKPSERLVATVMVLTFRVLTPVPRRSVWVTLSIGASTTRLAATMVLVGARISWDPAPPPAPPLALLVSPTRRVPPARPA